MPPAIFVIQVAWLLALLVILFVYIKSPDVRRDLPHGFGKYIPIEAPWLGALGGCVASFTGIFFHSRGTWRSSYNYWHVIRPLMGAVTGTVGCLLLAVTLRAGTGAPKIPTDVTTFDATAFIFGYAEAAFRQLLKTLTDAVLHPGGGTSTAHDDPTPSARSDPATQHKTPMKPARPSSEASPPE